MRPRVCHSETRAHVRLLGPCFKTGRMKPFARQLPRHVIRDTHGKPAVVPPLTACSQQKARPTAHEAQARKHVPRRLTRRRSRTKGYNTHRSKLPSHLTVSTVTKPSWHAPGISAHGKRQRRRPKSPKVSADGGRRPPAESNRVPCWLHSLPF